jgi:murein DD-endopeptidase MepM/ murein hydrolase activator NlpD
MRPLCLSFHEINTQIRDGKIPKIQAKKKLNSILHQLDSMGREDKKEQAEKWAFPVEGYGLKAVGGKNGNGYLPTGYQYLDGNRHKGHPAHDIFIQDKNQDGLDDKTKKAISILNMFSGWVVSVEPTWDSTSELRGGLYVMVYSPSQKVLAYYAHLQSVSVEIGQKIEKGEPLGKLGRTGLNAWKKRSPTHLHVMCLKPNSEFGFVPLDPFGKW